MPHSRKSLLSPWSLQVRLPKPVLYVVRRALCKYFREHTRNILWLDMCAPLPAGFKRKELWFLFPGGYHTLRILSWLVKVGNRQDASDPEETASELQLPLF